MDLYYTPGSVNCRSVLLAGKVFDVNFNLKLVNLMAGEHMTPEFLKMNPQHSLPTLVDNGFVLWESRAILTYLADKYGKCDSWYPKCPKKRALVHQRLYFDMGTLSAKYGDYYYPQLFAKQPADPEKFKVMEGAVALLEQFLDGSEYAAGDSLTLADLSLVATISTYDVSGFDLSKYPNIVRWYKKCRDNIPGYEVNQDGVNQFKQIFFP